MENQPAAKLTRSRLQLILLITFFAAPIIAAMIMMNYVKQHGVGKTKNHGDLVVPARPLRDLEFKNNEDKPIKFSALGKKWLLVYINNNECDQNCDQALYGMRQSRAGQKGEHNRIDLIYISTNGAPGATLQKVLTEHPQLQVLHSENNAVTQWVEQFNLEGKEAAANAGRVYIVDPIGNLMMSYEKGFDVKGLANDLIHLLKVSQIG